MTPEEKKQVEEIEALFKEEKNEVPMVTSEKLEVKWILIFIFFLIIFNRGEPDLLDLIKRFLEVYIENMKT